MKYSGLMGCLCSSLLLLSLNVSAFNIPQPEHEIVASRVAMIQVNAAQGDPKSQYFLGLMHLSGRYLERDIDLGIQELKTSASKGNRDAQRALADLAFEGKLVDRNLATAEQWYLKLADNGDHWAKFRLGFVYAAGGNGVQRNCGKAVNYFSDAGDKISMGNVAWILATCPEDKFRDGERAVRLATELLETNESDPTILDNLAAAYAETGNFAAAVATQQRAIVQLEHLVNSELKQKKDEFKQRLNHYKKHQAYREVLPLD